MTSPIYSHIWMIAMDGLWMDYGYGWIFANKLGDGYGSGPRSIHIQSMRITACGQPRAPNKPSKPRLDQNLVLA